LEAEEDEQAARNESEPHRISIENHSAGDKPSLCPISEGRRGQTGQQPASAHRSGGVSVDGTSASSAKVSWENSGDGPEAQACAQAGLTSEAGGVAGEVGVLRSSQEASVMGVERRRDTCSDVRRDGGRRLRKEISRHDASSSSTLTIVLATNAGTKPDSESRIWEIRPFGSMRGEVADAGLTTTVSSTRRSPLCLLYYRNRRAVVAVTSRKNCFQPTWNFEP